MVDDRHGHETCSTVYLRKGLVGFFSTFKNKMPNSHHRHKPKHHHQQPHTEQPKKRRFTAAIFMMAMFGIFGLSFAYFTSNGDILWSLSGTFAGMAIGYYFGHNMDKSAGKKA